MLDLGKIKLYLEKNIYNRRWSLIHQKRYIIQTTKRFSTSDCKPSNVPMNLRMMLTINMNSLKCDLYKYWILIKNIDWIITI